MRTSIALLTIFLVQIFFNIYKYFQGHTNYLENKLETILLYLDPSVPVEQKAVLRRVLLSKIGGMPNFGRTPVAPLDQLVDIAEKMPM